MRKEEEEEEEGEDKGVFEVLFGEARESELRQAGVL